MNIESTFPTATARCGTADRGAIGQPLIRRYTVVLSKCYAAPRTRQRGFFTPQLRPTLGDEEARIPNKAPGFITAESESPASNLGGFSLKIMEAPGHDLSN